MSTEPPVTEPRAIRSRRVERCAGCRLTPALCLCGELAPIPVRTRVVVLAHRKEIHKSSNTGLLATRMLAGASMIVRGEREGVREPLALEGLRRLVLFPAEGARVLEGSMARDPIALIVPDGNWSQARKMLRRDELTRDAEPVVLPPGPPSRYGLRRNAREGGLCTIEAIARAMGVLESAEVEARLLAVFEAFVDRQHQVRKPRWVPSA